LKQHPIEQAAAAHETESPLERASALASIFFLVIGICLRLLAVGDVASHGANLMVEMFIVIAAVFWAMHVLLTGRIARLHSPVTSIIAVFFVLAAVSAVRAGHLYNSLPALLDIVSYLLLFFLVIQQGISRRTAGLFICTLVACAAVLSLYAIFQYHYSLDLILAKLQNDPGSILRQLNQPMTAYEDLLSRVKDKRVFATFANPNSFAGFLLMTIPLTAGMLIDVCRARLRATMREAGALFLALTLQIHAFVLTFSKGGALTLILTAVLFAIMAFGDRIRRHKLAFGAIALAGVLVFAGGAYGLAQHARSGSSSPLANKLRGGAESMRVRLNYWKAGVKIVGENPLLGVGLNNFADHYFRHKLPEGREVRRAHNNYLQVAAEMGLIGLAAMLLLWGGLLTCAARRMDAPLLPPNNRTPYHLGIAAGTIAVLAAYYVLGALGTFEQPLLALLAAVLMACFWLVIFAFTASGQMNDRADPRPVPITRIGIVAGLAAFLLHGIVDYDLYVPGCAQTAWLLAALGIVLSERRPHERMETAPPPVRWAILAPLMLLCVVMMMPGAGVVSRVFTAEFLAERSRNQSAEGADSLEDQILLAAEQCRRTLADAPDDPEASYRMQQFDAALRRINSRQPDASLRLIVEASNLSEAIALNPLDDALRYNRARTYETIWTARRDDAAFHLAEQDYLAALDLNPTDGAPFYRLATMYREAAALNKRLLLKASAGSAGTLSKIESARNRLADGDLVEGLDILNEAAVPAYIPYIWAAAEALRTYPTNALYRACLGDALYNAGLERHAAVQYRKALEHDRIADIERLRLADETRAIAEKRAALLSP